MNTAPASTSVSDHRRPARARLSRSQFLGLSIAAIVCAAFMFLTSESVTQVILPIGEDRIVYFPLWPSLWVVVLIAMVVGGWASYRGGMLVLAGIVFVAVTWWAGAGIGFTLAPIWEDIDRAIPIMVQLLNPEWSYVVRVWDQWLLTVGMAVVAAFIGCALGLGVALLSSPLTSPNRFVSQAVKTLNSMNRAIPDVGWALLFVAFVGGTAFGLGPLAGILAMIMFNFGVIAKLVGENIDAVNRGPLEAADAAGASYLQRNRVAVLPQVMPGFISYSLYVFELNIRASAALGLVGVGGIGYVIGQEWARFNWERISALMAALVVVVLLVDLLSRYIRRKLI